MTLLEVESLSVRYGAFTALDGVSFALSEGQWLMLIGPNGAGKSTVVNAIAQGVPYSGTIRCCGRDLKTYRPQALARRIGVLSQMHTVGYAFTVAEVVRLGRYAYAPGVFSREDGGQARQVRAALELTGLLPLADRSVLALSGGELQRTFLAQLFAQDPEILLLDEPTNHLDLVYQKEVFSLIEAWRKESGRAVLSVVHDLSLAKAYGTDAVLLDRGRVVAGGAADEVFSPAHLDQAYDMDVYGWMRGLLGQWETPPEP